MIFKRLAVLIISGIFLASVLISGSAWGQNSVCTVFGEITSDFEEYSVNNSEETIVNISGIGEMKNFIDNEKVFFTFSLPDG